MKDYDTVQPLDLGAIVDQLPAMVAYVDRAHRYRYVNHAYEERHCRSRDAIIGRHVRELLGEAPYSTVLPAMERALAGEAQHFELSHTHPDGKQRTLQVVYTPDHAEGVVRGFITHVSDVTEQRGAELALRRSEETYARAEAIAHIGSWDWDITTGALHWTDEIYRIFGQPPQAFDATYQAFLDTIHPDDRQQVVDAVNACVADPAAGYDIEHRIVRADGAVRVVQERGKVYRDAQGRALRMIGTVYDVTEMKRTEDELAQYREHLEELVAERTAAASREAQRNQLILATATDGFVCANADGQMIASNAAYCRMLGYTSDEMLRLKITDIDANESPAEVAAHIQRIHAQGHDRFDTRHRRKDGTLIDVDVITTLAQIDDEVMIFGFARDISARKAAEAALIEARDTAERANRAKSDFLARMSHELRTPMNVILGFAQILEHRLAQRDEARFVDEIHQAGTHLLELINELLDLARIEAGRLAVSISPAQLSLAIGQALQLVGPALESRKVLFDNRSPDGIHLLADALRLKQILVNLLSNAVKFSPPGARVTLDCQAIGGDRLRVTIGDAGPGIPLERQQELFKPFSRIDPGATEGVGIGLALCKQLIELMAGDIGVNSAPGQGSRFWFELPLVKMPQSKPKDGTAREQQQQVLYVEDNAANLRLIEAMFECWPHLALVAATDGQLGLDLARRQRPAAILLDIHLPDMDGFAVLAALKADAATRDIPVIALPADAMLADIARGMEAGFHAYITKPVMMEDLLAALQKALGVR